MKSIFTIIFALNLVFFFQESNGQTNFQYHLFLRKHPLKADDLKVVQKNGMTIITVNATLTNRSKDTLYYFSDNCDESFYYSTDTTLLIVNSKICDDNSQTVIAIPPKGHRKTTLEIHARQVLTTSIDFRVVMFLHRAKNRDERIPYDTLMRWNKNSFALFSNHIKT